MTRAHALLIALLLAFSASAVPRVDRIEPSSGSTSGGTYVRIIGSDLTGFALACPSLECANYVQFGGELGNLIAGDDNEMIVITPPHAAGLVNVVVNIAGKVKLTLLSAYRYDTPSDSEEVRLLIPIAGNGPGAFGSQWHTDVTFHNASDSIVGPRGPFCNPIILAPCIPFLIEPHQTVHRTVYPLSGNPGAIVTIPRNVADQFDLQVRVQDLSRQSQTWGTAIPVVRPDDFRGIVRLHAIPTDARFRDTLRIYGYLRAEQVKVRILDESKATVIASTEIDLAATQDSTSYPPFGQIASLRDAFPQIASYETVGVEVEAPLVWAFVAVTNNETQHVTVIAPR